MCGIYDGRIFHFGAGSRQPMFLSDANDYELINAEISKVYVKTINGAKRLFFLEQLKSSRNEFINLLVRGNGRERVTVGKTSKPAG
jgi:hypothetical protein